MRDVAIVAFAQLPCVRAETVDSDVEMAAKVITTATERARLQRQDIGFWCSGSTDFLSGLPFSFVHAFDAVGAWPPVMESHVEMDGAWALYEAWVRLQHGDVDTALVYSFGKSSTPDELVDVLALSLDPYCVAPLGLDSLSAAALQASAFLSHARGSVTERDMAAVAVRSRQAARDNDCAQVRDSLSLEAALDAPYLASPLRRHDCPPIGDGAAAIVLAAKGVAESLCERPAWIRGFDHRVESQGLGVRPLWTSESTRLAGLRAEALRDRLDVAELCAPFTHQELILRGALGLDSERTQINPSGGALVANPIMSAGLIRMGEVALRIFDGRADRGLAHATSGLCLQQNLVCVLEG